MIKIYEGVSKLQGVGILDNSKKINAGTTESNLVL